jgi:hypothetical protein
MFEKVNQVYCIAIVLFLGISYYRAWGSKDPTEIRSKQAYINTFMRQSQSGGGSIRSNPGSYRWGGGGYSGGGK